MPRLAGSRVRLRPVTTDDYPFLLQLQTDPENLIRWRYRGTTVSPEAMAQGLWQGVLVQFLAVTEHSGEPIGLVVCYNPEFRHGYAYLAAIVRPEYEMAGWTLEANALFLAYLFESFDLRKIYLEVVEFNYRRLASGAETLFHVEGCLRDHEFHLGRHWHQYTLAIYRDEFVDAARRIAPALATPIARVQP